jgi:mannose-6-phosphate isomerase-like protein (cupin superfamily)
MESRMVFNAKEVEGFSPPKEADAFTSRLLVDQESVGSQKLVMNHFTLRSGKSTGAGSHPPPFDEIYYVLRGSGIVFLGNDREPYVLAPDSYVFIPSGTLHYLVNDGNQDLEMITVMPGPLVKGANTLYDQRKETWGKSFRLAGEE